MLFLSLAPSPAHPECLPLLRYLRDRPQGRERPRIPPELTPTMRLARDAGLIAYREQWVLTERGAAMEEGGRDG